MNNLPSQPPHASPSQTDPQLEPTSDSAATPQFEPSLKKRIEGLDELRGIAILTVLIAHFFRFRELSPAFESFNLGAIGVDLFFIISGFLIAKILLKTRDNAFYFRTFYIRRVFRIMPLFFVVLLLGIAFSVATKKSLISTPFYLTFTQNLLAQSPPFGDLLPPEFKPLKGLVPLWSLAVEEHVYLFLPMLCFFAKGKRLQFLLVAIACIGVLAKAYVTAGYLQTQSWLTYTNPFETWFRMQFIAFGCLLAMPKSRLTLAIPLSVWLVSVLMIGGGFLEFALAIVLIFVVSLCCDGRPPIRSRLLALLGLLCYGIYLLHLFVLGAIEALPLHWSIQFLIFMPLVVAVASISYHFFEMPIQRYRAVAEARWCRSS